jgi:hypothetical protein
VYLSKEELMNTQQSKALRLADWLVDGEPYNAAPEAADELRRLHSVNAELLAELRKALPCLREFGIGSQFKDASAAIAKAQE